MFIFGDIDNRVVRCWDDISKIFGIGVKFNKIIYVLFLRILSLFWFSIVWVFLGVIVIVLGVI